MRRGLLLVAALAMLAHGAAAEAPARSERPMPRPAMMVDAARARPAKPNPRRVAMPADGRPLAASGDPARLAAANVSDTAPVRPGLAETVAAAAPVPEAVVIPPAGMIAPQAVAPAVTLAVTLAAAAPRPRPQNLKISAAPGPEAVRLAIITSALRPMPRPKDLVAEKKPGAVRIESVAFVAPVSPDVLTAGRGGSICGAGNIQGRRVAPVVSRVNGCGIEAPVEVTAVDGVRLSPSAVIDCPTAVALDRWVRTGLKPAVGKTGGGVAKLQIAGSYTCRPRNNQRGAKISEHGRGKAVDIAAVVLANGTALNIARDWRGKGATVLKAAHRAACGVFGTTLGPGSDGFHEDHLHFDTAAHRNGAYCR